MYNKNIQSFVRSNYNINKTNNMNNDNNNSNNIDNNSIKNIRKSKKNYESIIQKKNNNIDKKIKLKC